MNGRGPAEAGPHDATARQVDGHSVTLTSDRAARATRVRGRQDAALVLATCGPGRFRHVWAEDEAHPVNGWLRYTCDHCGCKAAVPFVGDEVGQ